MRKRKVLVALSLVLSLAMSNVVSASSIGLNDYVVAGSCTTSLKGSSASRIQNITTAAGYLNGTVVQPGQIISVSALMRPRTVENGYALAGVYSGGKTVQGLGGGICQMSSTLYNALMNAGMTVVTRYPHSMTVSYLPKGQDAAISQGSKDLIFTNPYNTPVTIITTADGTNVSAQVLVSNTELAGRSYKFYAVSTGSLSATTYRDCYLNGTLMATELIASSSYAPHS